MKKVYKKGGKASPIKPTTEDKDDLDNLKDGEEENSNSTGEVYAGDGVYL